MTTLARPPSTSPRLRTLPGVYEPQHDTRLLAGALQREDIARGAEVLDLGTGSGALALEAARLGARVTAVDISWRAVLSARFNAMLRRQKIAVRHGDLASAVPGRSFDLVVSNPPYVPSPCAWPPKGASRSWDAGWDGRALLDRVCDAAPAVLRPTGVLLVVHSALCGVEATLDRLTTAGLRASVTERATIPFGPVLLSRLDWLRERGMPAAEILEELVIVRAVPA
ncbi:HemK2/MTQ2 family protein methyltransferase [Streptomyces sp. NPDC088253]|uniref:HemK2/MTQ2 family protein methyltransferase n=1 Tax=Streptomyces sp. NPDC088253 TaxID=3365846 RepID=UPI003806471F